MSDEDKEIDVESGDDDDGDSEDTSQRTFSSLAEKRAHHNALERKRRDHIKDSFTGLRDSIPSLEGEKSSRAQILHKAAEHIQYMQRKNLANQSSRAQILHKATEHIQYMRRKNHSNQADIDELKRHNMILDQQVRQLEKARAGGTLPLEPAAAALLNSDLILQPATENVLVQSESLVKTEPVILERPNNAGDHDDYTIAPKRLKTEPT